MICYISNRKLIHSSSFPQKNPVGLRILFNIALQAATTEKYQMRPSIKAPLGHTECQKPFITQGSDYSPP